MESAFKLVLEELSQHCPRCGEETDTLSIRGPTQVVLSPCGHTIDATMHPGVPTVTELD